MNEEHFKILLEDLYDKYNHTKKSEVPNLVTKYNGQEFEAIKTFYFKYNYKTHPKYDPNAGTDVFIKNIIEQYSEGKRPIRDKSDVPSIEEQRIANLNKEKEEASLEINNVSELKKEELLKFADEKIKSLDELIEAKGKKLEEIIKKMDYMIEDRMKKINEKSSELISHKKNEEHIEIKINLDYAETDIEIPKDISTMAVGTRFLMLDQNKKILAFEIKDIFCDYVTNPDKCIKEINIQRI